MKPILSIFLLAASAAFALTTESAGPPPSDLKPAFTSLLQNDGIRVLDGKKVVMELWLRSAAPTGPKTTEDAVTFTNVPQGSLMGVARFSERGADRRGQPVKPGVYTMRLSFFPANGDHQGVAPQRDFFLLSRAADDAEAASAPAFQALVDMSKKASGSPHPLVLSVWKAEPGKTGVAQEGDTDTVLYGKIGDLPVAIIVAGKFDH